MIRQERVRALNGQPTARGRYVVYWMQASQRAEYNHALEYAAREADASNLPLVVFFGLTESYPGANRRHYHFMLEGLRETEAELAERGIKLLVRKTPPQSGVVDLSREAALVVTDRGYLRHQKEWRASASRRSHCPMIQVETDVVVPVEEASVKEEYSAATFRPRIMRKFGGFLEKLESRGPKKSSLDIDLEGMRLEDVSQVLKGLDIDQGLEQSGEFRGGAGEARKRLRAFLQKGLEAYEERRNDPSLDHLSHMSPYLHFGQISPLYIALEVSRAGGPGARAYLEELVVRRELSMNFVHYNPRYDSLDALPAWALETLREHRKDRREYLYSRQEFEHALTHDPYWNAAQREMTARGKMHGYMRMYWGKKIIEWSAGPEEAYRTAVYLNDRYELDGRDPNGYTGVLWCFGKHDRAWRERDVMGKLRYMSPGGLERKFDISSYVERVQRLHGDTAVE